MTHCGGNHLDLGCGEFMDEYIEEVDTFYVPEYDEWVPMHVACADAEGLVMTE